MFFNPGLLYGPVRLDIKADLQNLSRSYGDLKPVANTVVDSVTSAAAFRGLAQIGGNASCSETYGTRVPKNLPKRVLEALLHREHGIPPGEGRNRACQVRLG